MKKIAVFCCVLLADFSLFAQARTDISVYIPPVTGQGGSDEELAIFTEYLVMEVVSKNFTVAATRRAADYVLSGSVSEYVIYEEEEEEEEEYLEPARYALHLILLDNNTELVLVEQDLIYFALDEEVNDKFPRLVFDMLANIPMAGLNYSDEWRCKYWYFGVWVNWTPRIYTAEGMAAYPSGFGAAAATELHFLDFMSFEAGAEVAEDAVPSADVTARSWMLEFPLLLKAVFKPGMHFMLEPYGGVLFNVPLNDEILPPLLAWTLGFQAGVKAGQGAAYFDARFAVDIGDSRLRDENAPVRDYQRVVVKIGIGYKYGIFERKKDDGLLQN